MLAGATVAIDANQGRCASPRLTSTNPRDPMRAAIGYLHTPQAGCRPIAVDARKATDSGHRP